MAPEKSPLRVGIILTNHFTLSAFAAFVDHLRLAADEGDRSWPIRVQWSIMAAQRRPIVASCGVMVEPTSELLPPFAALLTCGFAFADKLIRGR